MAATLAGVCQVPLTAVLLLFELTQDYRIVLPLLGAVGLSSWITSGQIRRDVRETKIRKEENTNVNQQPLTYSATTNESPPRNSLTNIEEPPASNLCDVESSLCADELNFEILDMETRIFVSEAMRTKFVTVLMSSLLTEAVSLMLEEKQSCAVIADDDNFLIGIVTLGDIQEFSEYAKTKSSRSKV